MKPEPKNQSIVIQERYPEQLDRKERQLGLTNSDISFFN